MNLSACTWHCATRASRGAALTVYELCGDVDSACASLGIHTVQCGRVGFRRVPQVDDTLCMRAGEHSMLVSLHGGKACARAMEQAFERARIFRGGPGQRTTCPEAASPLEASVLAALAVAQSSRAVPLLLSQPERWMHCDRVCIGDRFDPRHHLLAIPTVAIVGPSNIGKSSLINVLAGREVAVTFDQPGTTRDMVRARVEVDGLVVDFLDCPGIDETRMVEDQILADAQAAARHVVSEASCVIWCSDARCVVGSSDSVRFAAPTLHVATRCDLHGTTHWASEKEDRRIRTSARTGEGISTLAVALRKRLVPDEALQSPQPWRFWDAIGLPDPLCGSG